MAYRESAKNFMLDALAATITHVSLHSAFPATPANELSGAGYARQPIAFAPASGGEVEASNQPTFDVPAGASVAAAGFWTASTAGTMHVDADVRVGGQPETYANAGEYKLNEAKLDLTDLT